MQVLDRLKRRYHRATARHAVVVAGLGRCGTKLIFKALKAHGYAHHPDFITRFDGVAGFAPGFAYKTHDLPPEALPEQVKLIFLFGDPLNIAISVHERMNAWGRRHHDHMQSALYVDNDCVFERDTLRLHEHFAAWYRPQPFPFLSVRYEALGTAAAREALADFLGHAVPLPPFRPRRSDWTTHPRREALKRVYGDLQARVAEADDVRRWPAAP